MSFLGQTSSTLHVTHLLLLQNYVHFLVYVPGLSGLCFPPVLLFSRTLALCLANCFPKEAAEKLGALARPLQLGLYSCCLELHVLLGLAFLQPHCNSHEDLKQGPYSTNRKT